MNEIQEYQPHNQITAFTNAQSFDLAQRQAKALAESDLVPMQYRGNLANCLVALEVSQRCGSSPLMVMQNLNIIHGRPSWSATYIIAAINSCGRFEPLRFKMEGQGDNRSCVAWTKDKNGEIIEGPPVSIEMAKKEGWFSRKDKYGKETSKWQTMPELMLRYRSASFFGRLYASEILMGMRSEDEEREMKDVTPDTTVQPTANAAEDLNKKIRQKKSAKVIESEAVETSVAETPAAIVQSSNPPEDHF